MSYNSELSENNAALRSILEQAQSLPNKDTGGGVKITEYIVTEDADRGLWLNEQKIKLVKGINIICLGWIDNTEPVNNRSGLTTLIAIFWNGVAGSHNFPVSANNPIKAIYACTNGYNLSSNMNHLCVGNTSKVNVDEEGNFSVTTSATGVTVGNYANSFIGAGNTYRLIQAGVEV